MDLSGLLQEVISSNSPDLHLQVGQPPIVRVKTGSIVALSKYPALKKEDLNKIIDEISSEAQRKEYMENLEVDFSFSVKNCGRFRVNLYNDRYGPAIAFRVISDTIPTLQELGFGSDIEQLLQLPNGLVLVTGPTGSGKSTTLASMIEYINEHRNAHIITIEDPIEYVYKNRNCLISQREVKLHTHNFSNAIRSALRQDPDVVLVGEMRDLETISAVMTLAETGHLVFSTLHTTDSVQTIDRIIDVFPSDQQGQIRNQASNMIKAVISQILVPHANGEGRIAAREIMISNDAIRNCIAQGQTVQIYSMIQIGAADGMILMDKSLEELVKSGNITKENALAKANDLESLAHRLKEIK
jgi:twitching motility protein PilT